MHAYIQLLRKELPIYLYLDKLFTKDVVAGPGTYIPTLKTVNKYLYGYNV
jgi:hypothetical protein